MGRRDETDFLGWVESHRDGLRKTAFLMCGDWYLADDLVQDTLVRLFASWPRVSAAGDPGPYARKVLLNRFRDLLRRPASVREVSRPELPESAVVDVYAVEGDRDRLIAGLASLAFGQRAVLVLRYWEDMSVEQTAHILGTSPSTVRSQASRGLASLRESMEQGPRTTPGEVVP